MDELISRRAAIDAMFANMPGLMFNDVLRILRTLPSAQLERKTGRWERHVTCHGDDISGFVVHEWICSECGGQANVNAWRMYDLTDFCPNCGADMRGGVDGADGNG